MISLVFTGLLASILLVVTGSTAAVEATVAERTAELRLLNTNLNNEMAERERIASCLHESESVLRTFFESGPMMMGVIELAPGTDDMRHISVNPATAAFLEKPIEEISGRLASEIGICITKHLFFMLLSEKSLDAWTSLTTTWDVVIL